MRGQTVYRGDLALSSATSVTGLIFRGGPGSSTTAPVGEMWSRSPVVGDQYCVGGATTGELCGWVVSKTRQNLPYPGDGPNVVLRNGTVGEKVFGQCTAGGDSGAPVFTVRGDGKVAGKGIHSGSTGNTTGSSSDPCRAYYTDIREAFYGYPGSLLLR